MKKGFDNKKYVKIQSTKIRERIKLFDKLYLEIGGKLFDDSHAARVLPWFLADSKLNILKELKDELVEAGWNVKIKPPREDFDEPFMFMPIKVVFNNRGPAAYVRSGDSVTRLNEETIDMLDEIDIASVDMDIRPYDWEVNGRTGRSAYLQAINVTQNVDRFGARYSEEGHTFE